MGSADDGSGLPMFSVAIIRAMIDRPSDLPSHPVHRFSVCHKSPSAWCSSRRSDLWVGIGSDRMKWICPNKGKHSH